MKTLILFIIVCTGTFAAGAQTFINLTPCPLRITVMCYDPASCTGGLCASSVDVPALTTIPLPACVACNDKTG